MDMYVPDKELDPIVQPMASPFRTAPEILARFPPTRFLIGSHEIFKDESIVLMEKMM